MKIEILGPGCAKCKSLEAVTKEAVEKTGISADIKKVSDAIKIMGYGVMSTPGLVVDGEVKLTGRVPSVDEIVQLLESPKKDITSEGGCSCGGNC